MCRALHTAPLLNSGHGTTCAFYDAFLYHIKCHVLRTVHTYQALLYPKDKFTLPCTAFFVPRLCAALFIQLLNLTLAMIPHAAFLYHIKCHVLRTVHTTKRYLTRKRNSRFLAPYYIPRSLYRVPVPHSCTAFFATRFRTSFPRISFLLLTSSLFIQRSS